MNSALKWGGLMLGVGMALFGANKLVLTRFVESEFYGWKDQMNVELLRKLDLFAQKWGAAVVVSPVEGAIGRHLGSESDSQHNIDKWGEVRAIDVFPKGLDDNNMQLAFDIAKECGFTGIGIYTDTSPSYMMHLDVRFDRAVNDPATWGRVNHSYVSILELIDYV